MKELRRFLGIISYYRSHIKDLASISKPLTDMLRGKDGRSARRLRSWGPDQQKAFKDVLEIVNQAETLHHENPSAPLILTTDASSTHAGAVLEQIDEEGKSPKPLAYFSKAFPKSVKYRSAFNRELTAAFMATRYFKHRIRGRHLIIRTDHASLVRAVEKGYGEHSPSEIRMLCYVKEFNPQMIYIKGEENIIADTLSRPTYNTVPKEVDVYQMTPEPTSGKNETFIHKPPLLTENIVTERAENKNATFKSQTF